jgi:hypothetical protein
LKIDISVKKKKLNCKNSSLKNDVNIRGEIFKVMLGEYKNGCKQKGYDLVIKWDSFQMKYGLVLG